MATPSSKRPQGQPPWSSRSAPISLITFNRQWFTATLFPVAVKFAVENLFPGIEVEFAFQSKFYPPGLSLCRTSPEG